MPSGVILWTHRDDIGTEEDPTQRRWIEWMAATFPPEVCQNFVLLPVYREWTVDRCLMLAENWRLARARPTGGPASDGHITRYCTKCSGPWGAGASRFLLATRCTPLPGSSSSTRPIPTSNGLASPSKPSAGSATRPTTNSDLGPFVSPRIAVSALADAESAVALLDAIEADPARVREPCGRYRRDSRRRLPRRRAELFVAKLGRAQRTRRVAPSAWLRRLT